MSDATDTVERFARAFREQDRAAAESLMAADFRFTSPQDDGIDKRAWLDTCFPTADHFASQTPLQLVEVDGVVLSRYEYELHDGTRWRNTEATVVRDGKVVEVEVYFGGRIG